MDRGRQASTPMQMTKPGWMDVAARVGKGFGELHIALLGAGVAFYGLLALIPAITASVALVGLVYDPVSLVDQAGWLLNMLPEAAARLIRTQLRDVAGATTGTLGLAAIISIAIALWSSSNATGSIVEGLNLIYGEDETRGFVKLRLSVIALTLGLMFGLASMLIVVAAIPAILAFVGAGEGLRSVALILRWPVMFCVGIGGIAVLYRYGPDRRCARWRWLTPGATVACLLWVVGTFAFSFYVGTFGSYNETFGALAGVIILMTWMWLSALVLLLGAQIDAELEAQTRRDSTVGEDRPMGKRGAVKADTLGPTRADSSEDDSADKAEPA